MKKFSVILIASALSLSSTLFLPVSVRAGESLREKLIDSKVFSAVYAIDDYLTMVTAPVSTNETSVYEGFKTLCTGGGAVFERSNEENAGEIYGCAPSFTVSSAPGTQDGSKSFLIKHSERQPVGYRTPVVPSYAHLLAPAKGRLQGSYSSTEIYQYVYALCKKENGNPAFVVPKRYGRYVRLTKVTPADAFEYLTTSVKKTDAWYAACEGEKKFMLEKEYAYSEKDRESLIFYPNRGLEGISFVSAEDAPSYKNSEAAIEEEALSGPDKTDFPGGTEFYISRSYID
jgi:hypothetical protein